MPEPKHFEKRIQFGKDGPTVFYTLRMVGPRTLHLEAQVEKKGIPVSLQVQGDLETALVVRDDTGVITEAAKVVEDVRALLAKLGGVPPAVQGHRGRR